MDIISKLDTSNDSIVADNNEIKMEVTLVLTSKSLELRNYNSRVKTLPMIF